MRQPDSLPQNTRKRSVTSKDGSENGAQLKVTTYIELAFEETVFDVDDKTKVIYKSTQFET